MAERRGPKGKYEEWITPDGLIRIRGWARDGFTDSEICQKIGIAPQTFCEWKNRFPEIGEATKNGRKPVIEEIEDALYKRAMGYDAEEKIEEITVDPDGTQRKHIRKTTRHIPADVGAMCFALKNLKRWKWKDRPVDTEEQAVTPVQVIIDV